MTGFRCSCGERLPWDAWDSHVRYHERLTALKRAISSLLAVGRNEWAFELMAEHDLISGTASSPTLECSDCGERFASVARLADHTVDLHGRGPTREERTPIGRKAA